MRGRMGGISSQNAPSNFNCAFCAIISSMVLTLEIPPELERKLTERASAIDEDASQYVRRILERDLTLPSLDDVLAPLRDQVERSQITDDELDALVEQARQARAN